MALALFDRVQETTTTTGTGSVTLGGAVPGFQSFAVVGNGNTCYYTIVDGTAWEVGIGTYSTSGPTLARTTVLSNSSGTTSPITLAAGTKTVFLTYPAEKSVNLDASGNVSPLGTVSSGVWQGSTVGVAYGGTGVTSSSGANSVMLRDANQNVSINRLNQSSTTITAAGTTTTLTAASTFSQILVGTGGQTFKLPDATTLTNTTTFEFNNNATGVLTITDNANATVGTITSGGAAAIALLSNGTVGGTWDVHAYIPENVTWGTNSLALSTTVITGGTWNGGTIATGYGGTGLTSYTSGGAVYANSSSTLTSGTLPVTAGGTGNTTGQAASTTASATFNSGGAGDASGTTFNGSVARTISYNTIGAPSTSGTNATGTWGISVSGNSATTSQTNFSNLTIGGSQVLYSGGTVAGPVTITGNDNQLIIDATSGATAGIFLRYSGANKWEIYNSSTSSFGLYNYTTGQPEFTISNATGVANFRNTPTAGGSAMLTAANYNSYAPTLTGTGATGTWAINITGSAGSAGSATTAVNLSGGPVVTGGSTQPYIQLNSSNYATTYPSSFGVRSDASGDLRMGNNYYNDFAAGTQGAGGFFRFYVNNTTSFPNAINGTLALTMASSGSVTASVDSRAPIFYDSDNTAYYLNAASTSNLNAVNFNGVLAWADGTYALGSPSYGFRFNDTASTINAFIISNAGHTTSYASSRAPIFYDSNNTGYYGDFASTSLFNILNFPSGSQSINTTTPGTATYQLNFTGQGTPDYAQAITWGWTGSGAQAGIYVQSSGSYGTKMYIATTDSFATGSKTAMSIDHVGTIQVPRSYLQSDTSLRAPIFYDSNDTSYYVNPNGMSYISSVQIAGYNTASSALMLNWPTSGYIGIYGSVVNSAKLLNFRGTSGDSYRVSTAQLGGAAYVNGDAASDNGSAGVIIAPGGARYATTASVVTGAIKITIPEPVTDVMCTMTIRVYTYDGASYQITCGGYPYGTAGTSGFVNTFAYMNTQRRGTLTVRFGTDGSNACVWIGETGTSWNYPQIAVIDFTTGYYGRDPKHYADGWGISFVSSFNTVFNSVDVYAPVNSSSNSGAAYAPIYYDSNDTGYFVDPNSRSRVARVDFDNLYLASNTNYGFIGSQVFCDTLDSGISTDQLEFNYSRGTWAGISHDSLRAPLYYDYDDTAYYLNPNSNSRVVQISTNTGTGIYLGNQNVTTSDRIIINWHTDSDYNYLIGKRAGGWTQPMDISFYTGIRYHAQNGYGGHRFYTAGYDGSLSFSVGDGDTYVRATTNFYAPIMYDYNNTSYYVDPASTSNFGGDVIRSNISQGNIYLTGSLPGYSANTYPTLRTDGSVLYFSAAGVYSGYWSTYDFVSRGNVTAYSDETLKTNWRDLPDNFVETLSKIKHGIYDRIDTGQTQEGVSAQSLQSILPHSVLKGVDDKLTVNYGNAALVSAVELAKYVTALEQRIAQLEARL